MPDRIGRYDIVIQIARGGMATVFLARAEGHGGFDRYVALKLTAEHLRDDPEFGQHLVEEAKLVAHLRHQNVVPVLDVGEQGEGVVFLVMDYVPGDSLGGLFKLARQNNDPVTPRIGLRILVDALAGLHAAHEHKDEDGRPLKIIHRDFSPQNILVGTDGIARLTDFGIAKAASRASVTVAGTMKGKVSYASPEQARGGQLDRRCDVWAAGVIAWEIFAGRKLYPANERTLLDVVKGPPQRLKSFIPNIPPEIDEAIARALGFELDERTPTAQQFARELVAAARPHNLIAEVDEVAEYVQRQVAAVLEDRKTAIADARARREGTPISASATPSEKEMKTVPLPSLPDFPGQPPQSQRAAPPQPPPVSERWSTPSNPSNPSATPAGTELTADPLGLMKPPGLADTIQRFVKEKPAIAIGAASCVAVLLLGIIIVAALSGGGSKADKLAAASASASALPPVVPATTTPTNVVAPPSLGEPEPLPASLDVTANAPIAHLQLGKRTVDMEVPAPNVEVELAPDDSGPLAIVATSADGRVANANWSPGDPDLQLAFGDTPAPAAAPPVVVHKAGKKGGKKKPH